VTISRVRRGFLLAVLCVLARVSLSSSPALRPGSPFSLVRRPRLTSYLLRFSPSSCIAQFVDVYSASAVVLGIPEVRPIGLELVRPLR
jgi:hypothetical protein